MESVNEKTRNNLTQHMSNSKTNVMSLSSSAGKKELLKFPMNSTDLVMVSEDFIK